MEAQSKFFGGDGHNIFGHWQAKAVGQPGLPACFSFLLVTQEDGEQFYFFTSHFLFIFFCIQNFMYMLCAGLCMHLYGVAYPQQ